MRSLLFGIVMACVLIAAPAAAKKPHAQTHHARTHRASKHRASKHRAGKHRASKRTGPKPWCAPEVTRLADHTCYFDGGTPEDGRRTLVIYMHGMLATTPGFQWLQQRAMAIHAKRHHFTVLLPTSPLTEGGYVWPTSQAKRRKQEGAILAGLRKSRRALEARLGHGFDEVFVVGFSSGAYYASSLALRGALDVDGYIILAGGSSWFRGDTPAKKRAPVFVGVSRKDRQTRSHSRAFGRVLAARGFPHKVEEGDVGHMVGWTFMAHGIAWLRSRSHPARLEHID